MTEHVGDSDSVPAPAAVEKDKDNTTSIPPNQTPPPPLMMDPDLQG